MKAPLLVMLILCSFLLAFSPCLLAQPTQTDLLMAGSCELFNSQPKACQGVMVDQNALVWVSLPYGVTQESMEARMNAIVPGYPASWIDLVNIFPYECAKKYLKMVCPVFFSPCTVINNSFVPYPAIPHSVCRSVCEEFSSECDDFIASLGYPSLSCDLLNPQTGGLLFPPDALNPETEPATCVRLEDYQLGEIVFNCPPPTEFNIAESRYAVSACRYPCEYLLSIAWEHGWTDMRPLWITASVLNWFSFVSVIITILVFALVPKLRQWPTRIVIFMGIGLFFFHLGFIGNTFFSFSDLECANHWDFEYGSWCKFQSWTMVFGAMLTACWWVVQAFVVWWNVGLLKLKDPLPKKLEPFFHVVCWLYPILCSFLVAWVPSQSATGGGLTGNPFCTFSESDIGVTWGVFVGVLIFQLTLVFFFLSWTVIRILITPSAEGNWLKAFGRRLPQQLLIITFCFVFLNVIVATVAQVSWSRDQNESLTNALTDLLVCHLTTLGDPADCSAPRYNNPSIYWYLTISTSTCGLFFGIIFLIMRGDTRKEVISSVTSRSAGSTHTGNTSGNTGGSSN